MRKNLTRALFAAMALMISPAAYADGPGDSGPDVAAQPIRAAPTTPAPPPAEAASNEVGRSGVIALNDVSLNVPSGYLYYSAAEARAYLQRNNAATPSGEVLGLLARADADIRAPGTWATVISYDAIGYVQPATASGLSDSNFEADVRAARTQQNRTFEGFATAPAFDVAAPNIVWAERAAAPGSQGKDLRYEQKVLGRYGVAGLTSIGSADQMGAIEAAAADLRGMLSFPDGRRHTDFQAAGDQVSNYSVPGLVTGVPTTDPQAIADIASADGQPQTSFGGLAGWFPWVALGVILLAIAGFLFMRKRRADGADDDEV